MTLQSMVARLGERAFIGHGQAWHDALELAQRIELFRARCRALEVDPEPALTRARSRFDQSATTSRYVPSAPLTFARCLDDEWLRILRGDSEERS